jgi:hypothetical protein
MNKGFLHSVDHCRKRTGRYLRKRRKTGSLHNLKPFNSLHHLLSRAPLFRVTPGSLQDVTVPEEEKTETQQFALPHR